MCGIAIYGGHRLVKNNNNKLYQFSKYTFFVGNKRNTFPHIIKYPRDYWPTPPGWDYLQQKLKSGEHLSKEEGDVMQVWWGTDNWLLIMFGIGIIVGGIFLAEYPSRLRRERINYQIMKNWINQNHTNLLGTKQEVLIEHFLQPNDDHDDKNKNTNN